MEVDGCVNRGVDEAIRFGGPGLAAGPGTASPALLAGAASDFREPSIVPGESVQESKVYGPLTFSPG
jgi:hypothetical protein